ncbi:hypothetical protein HanPI659440_Chr12g0457731 [Helianthus annuus]|nr:hypothetical protein HanPI659440_Chr12g0457731 [Helianthus annuus]
MGGKFISPLSSLSFFSLFQHFPLFSFSPTRIKIKNPRSDYIFHVVDSSLKGCRSARVSSAATGGDD